jgi:hypothetical protein
MAWDINNMVDVTGNLKIVDIFVNTWFFGYVDFAFLVILFATALLLNRYGFRFGQMIGIIFALSLVFATISSSIIMWAIVILIAVISSVRIFQNILLRV